MFKKFSALPLFLALVFLFSACGSNGNSNSSIQTNTSSENKIKVSVTFNAIKEFVSVIGKDKVEISTIIPDGTEAHGFEPKAQDLSSLESAKIFVYNGLEMESWAEEAVKAVNNEGLIIVDASSGADLIVREETEDENEEASEHEEEHSHGKYDPHLWLGITGAKTEATNIKNALVEADPENKDYYEENLASFSSQLENLYNEYKEKFDSLEKKSFVTGHAAFGYLCRDFGLNQNSVSDIYAEGEPSAKQLAELVEYCRENDVSTIFSEEMASPAISQTLANEVGAEVQTIYTMETNEDGKTYLERMEENLAKIYESLAK
ncbi:MAG: metal ABC transporter substrate-binding protein [Lachnospiraceae bacterium]|nr:metal ABC transporter substrate-binding protein [Lachnospiraceae bacterium]